MAGLAGGPVPPGVVDEVYVWNDLLGEHADILLDLAHVLAPLGRVNGAHAIAAEAVDLFQRKGNLSGVRESLRHLAYYAPA